MLILTYLIFIFNFNDELRISYANKHHNDIFVTWTTSKKIYPYVIYSKEGNDNQKIKVLGKSTKFEKTKFINEYINRVKLSNLDFNSTYKYKYGYIYNKKYIETKDESYNIKIPSNKNNYKNKFLLFGDMGSFNNKILKNIKKIDNLDSIFHIGDIAYDMHSYFGLMGNLFFSQIKYIAARIPYMTVPGNHESNYNFSHYKNRLSMPNYLQNENMFYSLEFPNIKIICFSSEVYYYNTQESLIKKQEKWLKQELESTDRIKFPWLITIAHRPMYCSNTNNDDCTNYRRDLVKKNLEELFFNNSVTIEFWAHEHSYERTCPLYDGNCFYGKKSNNLYINPIHIITGAGGCIEGIQSFENNNNWSLMRIPEYGYGILNINHTYLEWQQYSFQNNEFVLSDNLIINKT